MTTAPRTALALAWTFRWNLREHARALRAVWRHGAHARWLRPLLRVGVAGGLLLAAIGAFADAPVVYELGTWVVLIAVWALLFRWMGPWVTAWQTRRNDPAVRSEIRQTADDSGFAIHCPGQEVRLGWSGIARVVETPEHPGARSSRLTSTHFARSPAGSWGRVPKSQGADATPAPAFSGTIDLVS